MLPVEKRLYTYFEDLAMIERLEQEAENILSVHGQSLQAGLTAQLNSGLIRRFAGLNRVLHFCYIFDTLTLQINTLKLEYILILEV